MSSWDNGYNTDLLYTAGYYREINPLYAKFIFAYQGLAFPEVQNACELGFGMGVGINFHAVTSNTTWYGTDFNPNQVNFAQRLAKQGGPSLEVQLHLSDNDFASFAARDDLPQFDFICLHGIWSWISPENQQHIVDFVGKHLKVGGVFYISYNTAPGFTSFEPVRHLMREHNRLFAAPGEDRAQQLKKEQAFLTGLLESQPRYAGIVTNIAKRIDDVFQKDFHYVVQEYLNNHWDIMHFSDVVTALDRAKLSFACSATASELIDNINLTPEQQQFLAPYKNTELYESVRDFIVNQQFRRDFFVKGATKLNAAQRQEALNQTFFALNIPAHKFTYTYQSRLGKAEFKKEVYQPIVQYFADFKARSYGQAWEALKNNEHLNEQSFAEAMFTLAAIAVLLPVVDPSTITPVIKERCQTMNRALIQGNDSTAIRFLASPVLQGGLFIGEINMRLLKQYQHNEAHKVKNTKDNLSEFLQQELTAGGKTLNKDGQPISDKEEQKKIITETVQDFLEVGMKLYKQHHLF